MICIQKIYGFHGFDHQIIKKSWNVAPVTYGRKDGKWKIEPYTFCWTRNRKQWKPGYIYPSLHKGECDDVNDENEGTNKWPSKICFLPLPVPVLYFTYPTRPSPMSKTTTHQTLLRKWQHFEIWFCQQSWIPNRISYQQRRCYCTSEKEKHSLLSWKLIISIVEADWDLQDSTYATKLTFCCNETVDILIEFFLVLLASDIHRPKNQTKDVDDTKRLLLSSTMK